jgi:hypothetical protein
MIINFGVLGGGGGGGEYHLPTATASRLGGVKIGSGITVTNDGTISAEGGGGSSSAYTISLENYGPNDFSEAELNAMADMVDYLEGFDVNELPAARVYIGGWYYDLSGVETEEGESGETIVNWYLFTHSDTTGDYNDETGEVETNGVNVATFKLNVEDESDSYEAYWNFFESGQRRFGVENEEQMAALPAEEGDICIVGEHWGDAPEGFYTRMDYWGWGLFGCLDYLRDDEGYNTVKFVLGESPYFDSGDDAPSGAYFEAALQDDEGYYGIKCEEVYDPESGEFDHYGWFTRRFSDGEWSDDEMEIGDEYEMPLNYVTYSGGDTSMIIHSQNTSYLYGLEVEVLHAEKTYQHNNGEWIEVASMEALNEVSEKADQAYNIASNKFATGNFGWNVGTDPRQQLQYQESGAYQITIYDNGTPIDKGMLLHQHGTADENRNKYVTELVASEVVSKIVPITQDDYDDLQTKDANTLYVIIPDPNA